MRTKKIPANTKLYNLEEYVSEITGGIRTEKKIRTLAYQIPYGMAKGLANKAHASPHLYGTFFKIVENVKEIKKQNHEATAAN